MKKRVVHIYEPETGKNLNNEEERSDQDIINFHVGRSELSIFQVGNGRRSKRISCVLPGEK
jgi:hypothetical protein